MLKRLNPALTVVLALLADAAMVLLAALFYGVLTLALLGLTAGLAQSLAKLSLDSTIQRDVPERVRTQRLRPLRHHAAAGLGDRRLRRHRAAAEPAPLGLAVASVTLVAWVVAGAGQLAQPQATAVSHGTVPADVPAPTGRHGDEAQSSSSSARARSSLATGPAVRRSGCRPWR